MFKHYTSLKHAPVVEAAKYAEGTAGECGSVCTEDVCGV